MTIISFTFTTKHFEYVVLSGTKSAPTLIEKEKVLLPTNHDIPETVTWFETELNLLLNKIDPDKISYRLTINNVTNAYVSSVYYGQAVLNLLSHKKSIEILHTSPVSIKANKFNQPKETNLFDYLESLVGTQNSPWDKGIKNTALIGLLNLD